MQRRMVARQHAELRRQVTVLIGILRRQWELSGRDPLGEEPQEQQPTQQHHHQQQQQLPAALPAAQPDQQQGTRLRDLIGIHLWQLA